MFCRYFLSKRSLLILVLLIMVLPTFAQTSSAIRQGTIRLKLSDAYAKQLDEARFSRTSTGEIKTGIPSLDHFNHLYGVSEFRRVFRHAGKHEARHQKWGLHQWYELKLRIPGSELNAIASYKSLVHIENAEPILKKSIDYTEAPKAVPVTIRSEASLPNSADDPMLAGQWHYNNTGQTSGTVGADIQLLDAWKRETGRREVIVAVIDGGMQTSHADLAGNVWVNVDEIPGNDVDDDNNGYVDDLHGFNFAANSEEIPADNHATHVAGTIAAITNNGEGVAGIAGGSGSSDGVRVMSCAVFSELTNDGFAEAFVYAADHGALIAQNSWSYNTPDLFEESVLDAIDYFIAEAGKDEDGNQIGPMKGGIVIFGAGNSSSEEHYYPSYYPPVLAVAATNHRDVLALYSNFGSWIDISAPGGETNNVIEEGVLSTLAGNQYGYLQGTSMACPHVSGVAALVISKFGKTGFTPDALRTRLRFTSENVDLLNPTYTGKMGKGRINAANALREGDATPPESIADLQIEGIEIGKVTLSWTVPHDEGSFVAAYEIRHSQSPITEENFSLATLAAKKPAIREEGETETFTVTNLPGGVETFFAIKAIDFEDNLSAISNVPSAVTALVPEIVLSITTISKELLTAEVAKEAFTISNRGKGVLEFTIPNAQKDPLFARAMPEKGTVQPGEELEVEITFDASRLEESSYQKKLIIVSNDPLHEKVEVSLTLQVKPNGAPIASADPVDLNFKGVQVGLSSARSIRILNEGSETLFISDILFDGKGFQVQGSSSFSIASFSEYSLAIEFKPTAKKVYNAVARLQTDDAAHPEISISLSGEGLEQLPITLKPDSLHVEVDKAAPVRETVTLTNHSSFDREFTIDVIERDMTEGISVINSGDSSGRIRDDSRSKREAIYAALEGKEIDPMLRSLHVGAEKQRSKRRNREEGLNEAKYVTDFEEFDLGSINGQWDWFSFQGWNITQAAPDRGEKHLRGSAVEPGSQLYAVSPPLFGDSYDGRSIFTSFKASVNLDNLKGATWEIVPQDSYFVVTRVRFNTDGTVDVLSVNRNYSSSWNTLDIDLPSGYVDIAVELNGMGDGSSGFPVFELYINNRKVFSGFALAGIIDNVAFVCRAETIGGSMDIDSFELGEKNFIPQFINPSPMSGIIPAGQSIPIELRIDPTHLKFGVYESEVVATIDSADQYAVPVIPKVIGRPSIEIENDSLTIWGYPVGDAYVDMVMVNTGGEPVEFEIGHELSELNVAPTQGKIALNRKVGVLLSINDASLPGLYFDTLKIQTSIETQKLMIKPVELFVWEVESDFKVSSNRLNFALSQGETVSQKIQLTNDGGDSVDFRVIPPRGKGFSIQPMHGALKGTMDLTVRLDATGLTAGNDSISFKIHTNDPDRPYTTIWLRFNILRGDESGRILREVWSNVPGKKVNDIPLKNKPDSTGYLSALEGPVNVSDKYGARVRGYVKPPQTGFYIFYISSDDASELWLSFDEKPMHKFRIARVKRWVERGEYAKYRSQKSFPIWLQANKKYYIEVLHKEHRGLDHFSVGWKLPNRHAEFPIPGNRLYPFIVPDNRTDKTLAFVPAPENETETNDELNDSMTIYPNPTNRGVVTLQLPYTLDVKEEVAVTVMSLTGKLMSRENLRADLNREIGLVIYHDYAAGMYIVTVRQGSKVHSRRLLVR